MIKFAKENTYENQSAVNLLKLIINTLYIMTASEKNLKLIKNVFELYS